MFKSQAMGFATAGRHDEDVPQVTGSLIVVTFLFIDLTRSNWKNDFKTHLNGLQRLPRGLDSANEAP